MFISIQVNKKTQLIKNMEIAALEVGSIWTVERRYGHTFLPHLKKIYPQISPPHWSQL